MQQAQHAPAIVGHLTKAGPVGIVISVLALVAWVIWLVAGDGAADLERLTEGVGAMDGHIIELRGDVGRGNDSAAERWRATSARLDRLIETGERTARMAAGTCYAAAAAAPDPAAARTHCDAAAGLSGVRALRAAFPVERGRVPPASVPPSIDAEAR